ncbi:MAG: hypothetical protein R3F24_13760 [Gammaproteobacteria bacterium]
MDSRESYLLVHWPSDVIASYLLALCILSLGHLLLAGTRTSTPIRIYRWSLAIWILVGGVHATTGLALQLNP